MRKNKKPNHVLPFFSDNFYIDQNSIKQWSPQRQCSQTVLDLSFIKVTSMSCAHGMLMAGGFEGEVIYKNMDDATLHYHTPQRDLGIINHVDIIKSNGGKIAGILIYWK
jgi:hypothetical protein